MFLSMLVVISLMQPLPTPATNDFDTLLIEQLSTMLKTPAPASIVVEYLPQAEMQEVGRKETFGLCMSQMIVSNRAHTPNGTHAYCRDYASQKMEKSYLHGLWKQENENSFHVYLDERSGMETLIHEFIHFWLHYRSEPAGLINDEESVKRTTTRLMTSESFQEWLKNQQ